MKKKYLIDFEDAPAWLSHMDIEIDGEDLKFAAVRRNDRILGEFRIPLSKFERMLERLKED